MRPDSPNETKYTLTQKTRRIINLFSAVSHLFFGIDASVARPEAAQTARPMLPQLRRRLLLITNSVCQLRVGTQLEGGRGGNLHSAFLFLRQINDGTLLRCIWFLLPLPNWQRRIEVVQYNDDNKFIYPDNKWRNMWLGVFTCEIWHLVVCSYCFFWVEKAKCQ